MYKPISLSLYYKIFSHTFSFVLNHLIIIVDKMSACKFGITIKFLLFVLLLIPSGSKAQKSGDDIAKQLANPIASLVSVPFQNNFQFGIGGQDGYKYLLNFQPVIPVTLSKGLNLINRIIVPVVVQNRAVDMQRQNGLGDILYSAFFSPSGGGLTWGIGPAFSIPTATNDLLGSKKLLIGPTAVALAQPGSWTVGFLANNLWSVAGDENRPDVNSLFAQPFFSYNFKGGLGIGALSENVYDWKNKRLASGLMALNLTQVFKFGTKQVASLAAMPVYYYSSNAVNKPEWGARIALILVFPK